MRGIFLSAASVLALSTATAPQAAFAQETINYDYDALGRLIETARTGGANDVTTSYAHDKADNRTSKTVSIAAAPPSFAIGDDSVSEGGTLLFTVTRSGTADGSFSLDYATANGTAVAATDYTSGSGTITFISGDLSETVSISTIEDTSVEANETLAVNLSNVTGGATISDAQGTGTITNDDTDPPPSFSIDNDSVSEGGTLFFTVTRSGSTSGTFTIDYATANGTAVGGSDYNAEFSTLTFAAGDTSEIISILSLEDSEVEPNETLVVNLSNASGGATITDTQGTGTITNDDSYPPPSFAIGNASVSEGGTLSFTVSKTGDTNSSFSIDYATANGTAVGGSDYYVKTGTVIFSATETSEIVTVSSIEDTSVEPDETLVVNLSGASGGATISDSQGTGTITNDDSYPPPSFAIGNASISEGGTLSFTITKTGEASSSFSVNYATANGTAVAGSDYTSKTGTVTFSAAETSKTVTVSSIEDTAVEPDETLVVNLSGASGGATISDSQGTGTITNDDSYPPPSFAIGNASISEGGTLSFTITKTGTTNSSFSVNYATANGTAVSGSDYTSKTGTVTFAASEMSKTVTVSSIEDTAVEPDETLVVNLSGATGGATISDTQGTGTITNDDSDPPPSFAIGNASVSEGGTLSFAVSRSGTTTGSFTVNYATANGTAVAGSDYTSKSGTLTFASGDTSETVTVSSIEDTAVEPNETLVVNLSGASGGATISDSQGTGTITNDDAENQPPTTVDDFMTLMACSSGLKNVTENDSDPEGNYPLALVSVSSGPNGYAYISTSTTIAYESYSTWDDVVTYTVKDSLGATSTGTLNIDISGGICQ